MKELRNLIKYILDANSRQNHSSGNTNTNFTTKDSHCNQDFNNNYRNQCADSKKEWEIVKKGPPRILESTDNPRKLRKVITKLNPQHLLSTAKPTTPVIKHNQQHRATFTQIQSHKTNRRPESI